MLVLSSSFALCCSSGGFSLKKCDIRDGSSCNLCEVARCAGVCSKAVRSTGRQTGRRASNSGPDASEYLQATSALAMLMWMLNPSHDENDIDLGVMEALEDNFKQVFAGKLHSDQSWNLIKARWNLCADIYEIEDLPAAACQRMMRQVLDAALAEYLLPNVPDTGLCLVGMVVIKPGVSHEAWLVETRIGDSFDLPVMPAADAREYAVALMYQDWRYDSYVSSGNYRSLFRAWCVGDDQDLVVY